MNREQAVAAAAELKRRQARWGWASLVSAPIMCISGWWISYRDLTDAEALVAGVIALGASIGTFLGFRLWAEGLDKSVAHYATRFRTRELTAEPRLLLHCAKFLPRRRLALPPGYPGLDELMQLGLMKRVRGSDTVGLYQVEDELFPALDAIDLIKGTPITNDHIFDIDDLHAASLARLEGV